MSKRQSATPVSVTAASQLQITLNSVLSGSSLVFGVGYFDAGESISHTPATPTNTNGTFAVAERPDSLVASGGGVVGMLFFFIQTANSGTHTVTFNPFGNSGSLYANAIFDEWDAFDASALDKGNFTNNATAASSTGGSAGTTGTLSQANEVIYAGVAIICGTGLSNASISNPATSGYTSAVQDQNTSTSVGTQISQKTVSATTAQNATWAWTSDSSMQAVQMSITTFKSPAGGGSGAGGVIMQRRRNIILPQPFGRR